MPDTSPRSAPSLGTRFFVATALVVFFAIGAAVSVTLFLGNQIGEEASQKALARSSAVQEVFLARSIEDLGLAAFNMAEDPAFSAYVAEAISQGDVPSLLDQLDSQRTLLGYDFAMVLDPDGILVARSDDPTRSGEDLSGDLLFQLISEGYQTEGLWRSENLLYQAVATPIITGGLLDGFLVAAYALDDQDASELREVNDTEVLYLMQAEEGLVPVAKTLSRGETEDLLVYLEQNPELLEIAEDAQEQREVELQQQTWLALVRPLSDLGGERIGAVINLVSLDQQLEPFRRIGRILAAVGVMAMLIALVVSYLLPKRVLQPMQRLAEAAKKASEGDYDQQIDIDSGDEVGALGRAFSALLSELREKRDMEIYVNELAKNVPSQESSTTEAEPAARRQVMLLGIELRGGGVVDPAEGPRATLDLLTRDLRRISRSVHTQGGKVEAVVGHRIVATFEGERRSEQALSAAAEIASHSQSRDGATRAAAVVLTAGEAITGTITFDNAPERALTGETVEQLEGLLRVARTGTLLLSSRARLEFGTLFERTGVEIKEHRSTVSSSPLYSLAASAVQQFASPEITVTQKMGAGTTTAFRPATLSGIGVGMVLGERFEVLSELGAGGMGVVYKALDRTLNELVALKMLKGDLWGDPDRLERLKDELKLARKISHPNILRTFDFGEADGYPFISMEFVRGVTLKQLLERSGRLPLSAGLRTSRQLCRGLVAAHSQGILHRDIKPENLIIEPNGNVKLMDFGIARPMQRMKPATTEPGAIVGTPFYLAPEQLEGLEPDERADLYACGVVLYEIFTGHLPFSTQGNIFEIITRKLQESPTPPREYWDAMPADLERILMRCLARDRDERYVDVSTLLEELEILRA